MSVLRRDLLAGRTVVLAGGGRGAAALGAGLAGLGTEVHPWQAPRGEPEDPPGAWAASLGTPVHALVWDAAAAFGDGGRDGLVAVLDEAWSAVREVSSALIERGGGGKLVLVAPRPEAGELSGPARAAIENLARTVSVEWARHAITAVAVLPGLGTDEHIVAELVGYLLSPAGDYFTGCRFELGAAG